MTRKDSAKKTSDPMEEDIVEKADLRGQGLRVNHHVVESLRRSER